MGTIVDGRDRGGWNAGLGAGCCVAGAFADAAVKAAVKMAASEVPVCILAVGRRK